MSNGKMRIGFVGVGGMGQCAHLRNYARCPTARWWPSPSCARTGGSSVAARYGVPRVYGDHAAMLATEKLDGIVASQPFTRHGVLLPELLQGGVPVFTEKPLAGALEVGEKILAAAVKASGTLAHGRLPQAQRPGDACTPRPRSTG